jgi:hypothetical protein
MTVTFCSVAPENDTLLVSCPCPIACPTSSWRLPILIVDGRVVISSVDRPLTSWDGVFLVRTFEAFLFRSGGINFQMRTPKLDGESKVSSPLGTVHGLSHGNAAENGDIW